MKKLIYIATITILSISCGGNTAEFESQIEQLKQENTELKMQSEEIAEKDVEIAEYANFIMDIQNNLNQIRDKEGIITLPNKETGKQTDIQIKEDLQKLGVLLADNNKKIKYMKAKLANSNGQLNDLEKVVLNLTKHAEAREIKILGMKSELSDLGVAFDELYKAYEANIEVISKKEETIEQQEDLLNTAYYAYGTKKELKKNNITTNDGGFIGIGTTKKLKEDFNKDYFTRIDIKETTEITLGVKKAKIITTHPSGSYELIGEDNIEKIKITNPKEFWSVSKYLVIQTK